MEFHSDALLEHCFNIERIPILNNIILYSEIVGQRSHTVDKSRIDLLPSWTEFVSQIVNKNEFTYDSTNLTECSYRLDYPFRRTKVEEIVHFDCITLNVSLVAPVFTTYHTRQCVGMLNGQPIYLESAKNFLVYNEIEDRIAFELEEQLFKQFDCKKISPYDLISDALFRDREGTINGIKIFELYFGSLLRI
jgi:hypothetical protein